MLASCTPCRDSAMKYDAAIGDVIDTVNFLSIFHSISSLFTCKLSRLFTYHAQLNAVWDKQWIRGANLRDCCNFNYHVYNCLDSKYKVIEAHLYSPIKEEYVLCSSRCLRCLIELIYSTISVYLCNQANLITANGLQNLTALIVTTYFIFYQTFHVINACSSWSSQPKGDQNGDLLVKHTP